MTHRSPTEEPGGADEIAAAHDVLVDEEHGGDARHRSIDTHGRPPTSDDASSID
ncbi:hypothetical protein [Microbacterium sp. Gd 4-13]|uniref:hypothetical protein n=1 Tax=Microbacterium sp. Gd 4-13 TaxID=2173179 RepID=UPI0014028E7F|nr:hypothetical protein [Microbacterium sp. Gd 4-13]